MSTILGTISIGTLICVIYFSYLRKGNVPDRYAVAVFFTLLFSVCGIFLGVAGMTEKNRFRLFPGLGLGFNILVLGLISLILYMGLVS